MSRRRKEVPPAPRKAGWELVYINLMTLLMIFFMVLYAMESIGQAVGQETQNERLIGALAMMFGGKVNKARIERAEKRDAERAAAQDLQDAPLAGIAVEISREKIKLTLPNPLLFDSGSAQLRKDSLAGLQDLADRLKKFPGNGIVVEGHTDSVPLAPGAAFEDNFELSAHRALGILHFLTDAGGLSPALITPIGYGEFLPVAANTSAADRAKNRRIEIHIIREK